MFDKLNWLETFELGIDEIDEDHRELLLVMQKIERAAGSEEFDECGELLDELIDLSVSHFKREEEMLVKQGYPNVEIHKAYHTRLLNRALSVKEICKDIRAKDNFLECCHEMFGFLVDDIVTGDMKFKSFLENKGIIKRP